MPRTAPSLAGMLVTIELPAAYVFSYLILAEKINIDQIVGCLIIVLSLVVPGLIGKYKSR